MSLYQLFVAQKQVSKCVENGEACVLITYYPPPPKELKVAGGFVPWTSFQTLILYWPVLSKGSQKELKVNETESS